VTPAQTITVLPTGLGIVDLVATVDQPWLKLSTTIIRGAGSIDVSIINPNNVLGASPDLTASVVIRSPATGHSVTVPVRLRVNLNAAGGSARPIGVVDTPRHEVSGVTGTIGVTGWVLDDIAINMVRVYRFCVPADPAEACQTVLGYRVVELGKAVQVEGARPDVEKAFGSAYPNAARAGWGLAILTPMLPDVTGNKSHGGVGAIDLLVVAVDAEGQTTVLGPPASGGHPIRITLANDRMDRPFGNIDTPAQGGTVSGGIPVFGWVLTPDRGDAATIPINGSTITVFIDGQPVGKAVYNQCRGTVGNPVPTLAYCNDDVSSVFGHGAPQATFTPRLANPGMYRNLDAGRGPIGSFLLDTTTLADGMHSIAWSVTDSLGRTEGIGSRNFNVMNGSVSTAITSAAVAERPMAGDVQLVAPVRARTGFDQGEFRSLAPGEDGEYRIDVRQLDRVELQVAGTTAVYLDNSAEQAPMPIGATIDTATGAFAWTPGPAFIGDYTLVFTTEAGVVRIIVTVTPDVRLSMR